MTKRLRISILTSLIILVSCGQKSETNKNENTALLTKPNIIAKDNIEGFTLETLPKHWGRISIIGSDTFKVIECMTLSQITIYAKKGHAYLKVESFYTGTDSLLIKEFNRIASDIYEFNLESNKADSSLIYVLEITNSDKLIGDWTLKNNGTILAMAMANTDRKKFVTTTYPCD